jgi:hypothetical protein
MIMMALVKMMMTMMTMMTQMMLQVNLDRVEEEMAANYSDEEEDDIIHIGERSQVTASTFVSVGPFPRHPCSNTRNTALCWAT